MSAAFIGAGTVVDFCKISKPLFLKILSWNLEFFFISSLTISQSMAGNSQKFARIKLGIKLISDSVNRN